MLEGSPSDKNKHKKTTICSIVFSRVDQSLHSEDEVEIFVLKKESLFFIALSISLVDKGLGETISHLLL